MHPNKKYNPAYDEAFSRYLRYGTPITEPYYIQDDPITNYLTSLMEKQGKIIQEFANDNYAISDADISNFTGVLADLLSALTIIKNHNFDPNQPREPAGCPTGGQWVRTPDVAQVSDDKDLDKALQVLKSIVYKEPCGQCARHVYIALGAVGFKLDKPAKAWARYYGPHLIKGGFVEVVVEKEGKIYKFLRGDIAIIQPYSDSKPYGHIQMYDGEHWISDWVQGGFWAGRGTSYEKHKPPYAIYRYPDYFNKHYKSQ